LAKTVYEQNIKAFEHTSDGLNEIKIFTARAHYSQCRPL